MSSLPTPDDDFATIAETARLIGVNHATVGRWATGKNKKATPLAARKIGGRWMFSRSEVIEYVRKEATAALARVEKAEAA